MDSSITPLSRASSLHHPRYEAAFGRNPAGVNGAACSGPSATPCCYELTELK